MQKISAIITSVFVLVLFLIFLVLKLTAVLSWSWWWIAAPLWVPMALGFAMKILGIEPPNFN